MDPGNMANKSSYCSSNVANPGLYG